MSLAMYAAPFDNDVTGVSETPINRKRNEHQKTQKRYSKYQENTNSDPYNSEKVNSILKTIHNLPDYDDNLSNFEPIPPPESAGVDKTVDSTSLKPGQQPVTSGQPGSVTNSAMPFFSPNSGPKEGFQAKMQHGEFQGYNQENRFTPNYDAMYNNPKLPYASLNAASKELERAMPLDKHDILMQKLNYMITLLEQQQDERTNHVTEEVILYSFLGIFIIFIVDSFARVGKYVR
jgi:hypothetical protein